MHPGDGDENLKEGTRWKDELLRNAVTFVSRDSEQPATESGRRETPGAIFVRPDDSDGNLGKRTRRKEERREVRSARFRVAGCGTGPPGNLRAIFVHPPGGDENTKKSCRWMEELYGSPSFRAIPNSRRWNRAVEKPWGTFSCIRTTETKIRKSRVVG